ncbi:MAG: ABC transporter permease subunit, partial [Deinococcus sp.]|nr:ABC transporter permease subunit [Deinococcus sp.]
LDLMRSYAATQSQLFLKLRLPASLPFVFTSFKVGVAVSLVGAMISETETSNAKGLGFSILSQVQTGNVADLWILLLLSSLIGIILVSAVGWLQRLLVPWERRA